VLDADQGRKSPVQAVPLNRLRTKRAGSSLKRYWIPAEQCIATHFGGAGAAELAIGRAAIAARPASGAQGPSIPVG
jgi:hypothetical protein